MINKINQETISDDYVLKINQMFPWISYISKENREKDLRDFYNLDIIRKYFPYTPTKRIYKNVLLSDIFNLIPDSFIIVTEPVYIDKLYRDTYYNFYSEILNDMDRNCVRLCLFKNTEQLNNLYQEDISKVNTIFYEKENHEVLEKALVGTIVLRPLLENPIGRIIMDPTKLELSKRYLRLTTIEVTILGQIYRLKYFPFSGQDHEFITCAETSLWTIFEYYGQRYPEYRTVVPSEFINQLDNLSVERSIPSQGLTYSQKSIALKKFGFYPRVYTRDVFNALGLGLRNFKIIFHCYVESGIPVAMTISNNIRYGNKHAIVCIGHGAIDFSKISDKYFYYTDEEYKIKFVDSSELTDEYAVIDDADTPYKLNKFDEFSIDSMRLQMFIVPLYKRIFVDAVEAMKSFNMIIELCAPAIFKYLNNDSDKVVIRRCFLTSSRKYSSFRTLNAYKKYEKQFYANLPFAKFLWVMELSVINQFENEDNQMAFAEFVLDATASTSMYYENTILIRVGEQVGYKLFNESPIDMDKDQQQSYKIVQRFNNVMEDCFSKEFKIYKNNLECIG